MLFSLFGVCFAVGFAAVWTRVPWWTVPLAAVPLAGCAALWFRLRLRRHPRRQG
ncbi:hypothetical protein [Streptomyces coelicoflavus]|uniref:hypothetical protein n=1 Tax=Streptomyces coelicoflavus TaxID=285562 RepID=UPI003F49D2FF